MLEKERKIGNNYSINGRNYLLSYKKYVYPEKFEEVLEPEVKELGDEIINLFKEKELTYDDAYETLQHIYRSLKEISELNLL